MRALVRHTCSLQACAADGSCVWAQGRYLVFRGEPSASHARADHCVHCVLWLHGPSKMARHHRCRFNFHLHEHLSGFDWEAPVQVLLWEIVTGEVRYTTG